MDLVNFLLVNRKVLQRRLGSEGGLYLTVLETWFEKRVSMNGLGSVGYLMVAE